MNYQQILRQINYPTDILVLDFECYFDSEFSLKKMSTVEYVCDERFEFTGVGAYWETRTNPVFYSNSKLKLGFWSGEALSKDGITSPSIIEHFQLCFGKNFEKVTVVMQNAKFDALILKEKFNINPPYIIDTIDLARHYDSRMKHGLSSLAELFGLKVKGDTQQFKGLHYEDMDEIQKFNLAEYCKRDVEIETELFKILLPLISNPEIEIPLAKHTLDLYLNAKVQLDTDGAKLLQEKMEKEANSVIEKTGYSKREISGNISFVKILGDALPSHDAVPMKQGKNKMIPALAKDDEGMANLLIHPDQKVRELCKARLSIRSWPLHIKRVQNLINQANCKDGYLGMPLHYYGGHTGRWSGGEKINVQNFGGKGRKGSGTHPLISEVKGLLHAPDGYTFIISDYSQIEARVLAWIAGQTDLVKTFAAGGDVYSEFATTLFKSKVYKPDEGDPECVKKLLGMRRGFGKDAILGCIAFGTPILTRTGWKSIERISLKDQLWDGDEWVNHKGVIYKGRKSCVNVNGIWLTPEHEILQKEGWATAVELSINNQQSALNMESLQLHELNTGCVEALSPSNAVVPVVKNLLHRGTIWSEENLHAVMCVLKRHLVRLKHNMDLSLSPIVNDCLTEFVQLLVDVRPSQLNIMVNEVLGSGPNGSTIERLFLNTWYRYLGGINQNSTLIESITMEDMNQIISDSLTGSQILETADILYSGNYKRFQAGNMIVANCGYGMGSTRFHQNCRENPDLRPLFDSGKYDYNFIEKLIKTYRKTYPKIPKFWQTCEKMFRLVTKYPNQFISYPDKEGIEIKLIFHNKNGTVFIQLPSGRELRYRHARIIPDKRGEKIAWHWGHLWGGSITENIVQSIARDIMGEAILMVYSFNPIVCHIHDSLMILVKKDEAKLALPKIEKAMCNNPDWAIGLPIDVESKIQQTF